MKRIVVLGVCLLMAAALLCGCDQKPGNDVSVDLNAPVHTLDEFRHGDVSCLVTITQAKDQTATGAESQEEKEPVAYLFEGQEAVDLYNLLNRAQWKSVADSVLPTGAYAQMLTLDFFTGHDLDTASAYYGSFSISNLNRVIASASPNDMALNVAQAAAGTYDGLWEYVEKGIEEE